MKENATIATKKRGKNGEKHIIENEKSKNIVENKAFLGENTKNRKLKKSWHRYCFKYLTEIYAEQLRQIKEKQFLMRGML